nr:hypothetical protein [Tanacetum cinerariifolium]
MMNQFCNMKGIKREFSVSKTPQQNGVAERKNKTLIKAARTMLVDSKFPTTFWTEAVNTTCYVLNRALVIKPHNKTPYELIHGRPPLIVFMKPFGCPVIILNTRDYLGKIVEETLNIRFLKNEPNVKENRPDWLFDIDSLTISMNYVPFVVGFQTNGIAGTKDNIVAGQAEKKKEHEQEYILIPICTTDLLISQGPKDSVVDAGKKATKADASQVLDNDGQDTRSEFEGLLQQERQTEHINNTSSFDTISSPVSIVGPSFVNTASPSPINDAGTPASTNAFEEHPFERFSLFRNAFSLPHVPIVTLINNTGIFGNAYDDEVVEKEVDMNNVVSSYTIPVAPLTKFLKDHPKDQVISNIETHVQTRQMTKINEEHSLISSVQKLKRTNHKDFQDCLFACYLSQMESKKPIQALKDLNWVKAMQDKLLQFKLLNVWTLVDLPKDKWAIGTKWVFRNKKDKRGIVIKNKARLVAQEHTQEECIDYDEVFAPVARIEAIRLFLVYDSFKDFVVYQMVVKSDFLYGKIENEVYVCQPPGFEDSDFPDKVYKVKKGSLWTTSGPKSMKELSTEFETLMHYKFQMSSMGELSFFLGLQVQQKSDEIFISQDKYVADILKKFGFSTVKTASTPMEPNKALVKDAKAENEDRMKRAATIASSLEAEQDSGNINRTKFMAILNEPLPQGTGSCSGPRQGQGFSGNVTPLFETIMVIAQEKKKQRFQAKEIVKLKKRVKKLEKKRKSRPVGLRRLKKVGISKQEESSEEKDSLGALEDASKQGRNIEDIGQDAKIALVDKAQGRMHDAEMFGVDDFEGNEVFVDMREKTVEKEVSTVDTVTTAGEVVTTSSVKDSAASTNAATADVDDELTLAKTLIAIKVAKPKVISTAITTLRAKGIIFHEQAQAHKLTVSSSKDKGKAKVIEPKKPLKKKDQIALDEEVARKLEAEMRAEMEEEERIAREKDEANRAVIEEWDDVRATIDADRQLAEQIQAQEREHLSIEERSKLLAELIESRRKYITAKRAEEIRNMPPTKAQQKSRMCTYMRNMEGFKQKYFKGKSFDDIKKIFDKVYKRVNTFVDMDTENMKESLKKTKAEASSKIAGQELEQESVKKKKLAEQERNKVADDDTA